MQTNQNEAGCLFRAPQIPRGLSEYSSFRVCTLSGTQGAPARPRWGPLGLPEIVRGTGPAPPAVPNATGAILIGHSLQTEKASYVKWRGRRIARYPTRAEDDLATFRETAEGFGGLPLNDGSIGGRSSRQFVRPSDTRN